MSIRASAKRSAAPSRTRTRFGFAQLAATMSAHLHRLVHPALSRRRAVGVVDTASRP
ncbi:hypothetical protein AB5I41_08515 [Sphingomonas sp. MMS24-JH45]